MNSVNGRYFVLFRPIWHLWGLGQAAGLYVKVVLLEKCREPMPSFRQ